MREKNKLLSHHPRQSSPKLPLQKPKTTPIAFSFSPQDSFTLRYEDYNYSRETVNVKKKKKPSQPGSERNLNVTHDVPTPSGQSESEKANSLASDWSIGAPLCISASRFGTGEFARDPSAP